MKNLSAHILLFAKDYYYYREMTSGWQEAPHFRRYGRELVSKTAISLKKSWGGGYRRTTPGEGGGLLFYNRFEVLRIHGVISLVACRQSTFFVCFRGEGRTYSRQARKTFRFGVFARALIANHFALFFSC